MLRGTTLLIFAAMKLIAVDSWVNRTLAGESGMAGNQDGVFPAVRLNAPSAIAVSDEGTLYFVDHNNHQWNLKSIDVASGVVKTVAVVDGMGSAASFKTPSGLTIVGKTVYVSDTGNHCIRAIKREEREPRNVTTLCGLPGSAGQQDGRGTEARFSSPWGIAVDQTRSKLVVADYGNHRIRVVNLADGAVSSLGGSISGYKDGPAAASWFNHPASIALIPDVSSFQNFLVVVADSGNAKLRMIDLNRDSVSTMDIAELREASPLTCIAANSAGRKMVIVDNSSRLLLLDMNAPMRTAQVTDASREFSSSGFQTGGLALGDDDTIYVADAGQHIIQSWAITFPDSRPGLICSRGETCGCGMGNCSCGFYYSASARCKDFKDFCCPCSPGFYCDCFSSCNGIPKPCPEGTYNEGGGSVLSDCRICPAGHICHQGKSSPIPCQPAHYCPAATVAKCPINEFPCEIPCPPGTVGTADGSGHAAEKNACTECLKGFFSASQGSLQCAPCPQGTYSAQNGRSSCATCPAGYFCEKQSEVPQPCPSQTYGTKVGSYNASECTPCKNGMSSLAGSSSSMFCNITQAKLSPTTQPMTRTTPSFSSTLPLVIVGTPAPSRDKLPAFLVKLQANLGGIKGQDAFHQCCEITFIEVLGEMVGSVPKIYEICDNIKGCMRMGGRSLLQATNVMVKAEIGTNDEMKLVNSILDPSFSFTLASRLATRTGITVLTAQVQLDRAPVSVVQSQQQSIGPRNVAENTSSSVFAPVIISVSAALLCVCVCVVFRKRIAKICGGKSSPARENEDPEPEEMQDLAIERDTHAEKGRDINAERAEVYAKITPGTNEQITPRMVESQDTPDNMSLSSEVRLQLNGLDNDTVLPVCLVIEPLVRSADQMTSDERNCDVGSATCPPPRAPPVLTFLDLIQNDANSSGLYRSAGVEPSLTGATKPRRRLVCSGESATSSCVNSDTSSDTIHDDEAGSICRTDTVLNLSDCVDFFELSDVRQPEESFLEADDLKPLFDLACCTENGGEPYLDRQGLLEILKSLDSTASDSTVDDVYSSFGNGVEMNSRLSLSQLHHAWQWFKGHKGNAPGILSHNDHTPSKDDAEWPEDCNHYTPSKVAGKEVIAAKAAVPALRLGTLISTGDTCLAPVRGEPEVERCASQSPSIESESNNSWDSD